MVKDDGDCWVNMELALTHYVENERGRSLCTQDQLVRVSFFY
jgi:hypothetical protein